MEVGRHPPGSRQLGCARRARDDGGREMPEGKPLRRLVLLASPICLAIGCSTTPQTQPIRPVKTLVIAADNQPSVRSFPGKVEAAKSVDLAFQVPGLLIQEPGKEGQRIVKDQPIAQLR